MPTSWFGYDYCRATGSCRGGRRVVRRLTRAVLKDVLNPEYLWAVLQKVRARNGQAPGVDGVGYDDLSKSEWFELFRDLRDRVLAGTYRPQPPRLVAIAKAGGGTRTLRLAVVADRVLEKALADALTPAAEAVFLESSYGFRPGRDRFWLLAALKVACETHGLWVLTADDITKAFDHVPVAAAVAALRRLGVDPALVDLAEIFLKGHEQKEVGIAQGGALSPLILNLLLHFALDTPLTATRGGRHPVRFFRYADNIVVLTRTAAEGRELLERMRALLDQVGLTLKGDPGEPRDLANGDHLDLLGMRLTKAGNALTFRIPNRKWGDPRAKLVAAHEEADPTTAARQLAAGWVQVHAPASGTDERKDEENVNRLDNLIRRTGHRNALTRRQIVRLMRTAADRWERTVTAARNRLTAESPTDPNPTTGAAAYATAASPGVDHAGTGGDTDDTTTASTDRHRTGEGTAAGPAVRTESATPTSFSSTNVHRPSGRVTALPDSVPVPPSAPLRRARSTSSAAVGRPRHRPRQRPGGRPTAARPPPRPP